MNTYKDLCDRTSGRYIPKSALDFVGGGVSNHGSGARAVAQHIERIVHQSKASDFSSIKIMMNGAPGLGKTALALYLQSLAGCNKWNTSKYNGVQMKLEVIEEIGRQFQQTNLFGDYRMLHIDEADAIPPVAQVRFLSLLDDLPDGVVVACTSNCKLKEFESRFQTRFQVFEIEPPTPAEIESLLCGYVSPEAARQIATFACGNVRQALLDAKGVLQQTMSISQPALLAA
jgi:replication-associated recombination protein RarA